MSSTLKAASHRVAFQRVAPILLVLLLASCATIPSGPSIMALPGSGKSFDQFRSDDVYCKQYALEQVQEMTPNRAAILSGAGTAALGTAVGAAAGAAFGGASGAAIGAGSGLLGGTLMGSGTSRASGDIRQQRYDIGYTQCMYGKGHRVPVSGQILDSGANRGYDSPSQPSSSGSMPPPPPPGSPPPPPQ
ncbi:glycine zipper family protein [Nitrosospira sp. Is2]|uniref:glycine zipper family protein n=1 Tax=Nitrosospira sp. Is2 TaxID=3080532 RepID=UPI00295587F8|nr:glycine zipper family protein [Nitrosospira sp. Is2]WON73808.1 glycine zipper family protein [Nitrosospira sp. Is2]